MFKGPEARVDGKQGGGKPSKDSIKRPYSQVTVMLKGAALGTRGLRCSILTAKQSEPAERTQ